MNKTKIAIGIDIGGTNTKVGFINPEGDLLAYFSHPTDKNIPPSEFIKKLAKECEEKLHKQFDLKLGDAEILGVGAGAPMANFDSGMIEFAPNLGWSQVPLKKWISEAFKTPCLIENDANLAAIGEKKWGKGKNLTHFILVTLGTGVGTGLILDHKIFRGNKSLGGEGGHVLIPHHKTRVCSCGGVNHVESYLSAKGIKQTIFEETGENWSIEELAQKFNSHHPKALSIFEILAEELARGLETMSVLLAPEAFLIGGGVSKLGVNFDHLVQNKLNAIIHYSLKNKISVLHADLATDKGAVFGGAALIYEEIRP